MLFVMENYRRRSAIARKTRHPVWRPLGLCWRPNLIILVFCFLSNYSWALAEHQFTFTKSTYSVTIPENVVGKHYVTPTERMGIDIGDPDSGIQIKFRISGGDKEKVFKAESRCVGDFCFLFLRTKTQYNVLNRERFDLYKLKIRATVRYPDNRDVELDSETIVSVRVLDTNDLSPFFSQDEYDTELPEDTPLHGKVVTVRAEDADIGINGQIYYRLSEFTEQFAINPVSGVITLTRPLFLANHSSFQVVVLANDRGPQQGFVVEPARAKVNIHVRRVNKHQPQMHVRHLTNIIEHANGNIYAVLRVEDEDIGPAGDVSSVEIVSGDEDGCFQIVKHEEKVFNLIYIKSCTSIRNFREFYLTLKAEDKGNPRRFTTKQVQVRVTEAGNQTPFFEKEIYAVNVSEIAPVNTLLIRFRKDQERDRELRLEFSISAGNEDQVFRISNSALYTAGSLDFETRSEYVLIITAKDRRSRKQSSAKVIITVIDANDNDPLFPFGSLELKVEENEPAGSFVYQITARDADSGENGYISYSIANLDPIPFEIDPFTGVIRVREILDYEAGPRSYLLKVRASDWGTPYRRQSELMVRIFVKDVNDNRPQFETVGCQGNVDRTAPLGTQLVTLVAVDFDQGTNVSYRIVWGNEDGCFLLNANRGTLSVGCDLTDLDKSERYINVTATDGLYFADVTTVRINLVSGTNTAVSGPSFECQSLELRKQAERRKSGMTQGLEIEDSLPLPLPARYGKNLHAPEFLQWPTVVHVNESAELGASLVQLKANDRDLGYNGLLVFVVSGGDDEGIFQVDMETGNLRIAGVLDRERRAGYALNISVCDLGKPQMCASKLLRMVVEDVNDNPPEFEKSLMSVTVTENCELGSVLAQLVATDPDEGDNGRVTYQLMSDSQDFRIDPNSGILTVSAPIDRERMESYRLLVVARDGSYGSDTRLSSTAVIRITVQDVNDVAPQFAKTRQVVKIREDIPEGSVVAIVEASDPDSGPGGQIRYSITKTSPWQEHPVFIIDDTTGVVRLLRQLDYEDTQVFTIYIEAKDQGSPSLSSEATLIVEVTDLNENFHAPTFEDYVIETEVPENSEIGTILTKVEARDEDPPGHDSTVMYSISGGTGFGLFSIDNKGLIRTRAVLDRETKSFYWLTVVAQDHGIVPLSSSVEVLVRVLDVNDHVPLTEEPVYWARIAENSAADSPVVRLTASDADNRQDQNITFQITAGNPQSLFSIDPYSGLVSTTRRRLDRENQEEHVLEVTVSDNGSPPLSSTTRVVVRVEDVNDNEPEFLERFYKAHILPVVVESKNTSKQLIQAKEVDIVHEYEEDTEVWTTSGTDDLWAKPIFRVIAVDRDSGLNGQVEYSLIGNSKTVGKFQIHPDYGIIYTRKNLKPGSEFSFKVKAEDRGFPRRSSIVPVLLQVGSVPEEPNRPPELPEDVIRSTEVLESDPVNHALAFITANDPDRDILCHSIVDGNEDGRFSIHWRTGQVIIASQLDSEAKSYYCLNISITDGLHYIYTQLEISVLDVNDNYPEFTQRIYMGEVGENDPVGTEIVSLAAHDPDEDKRVFYAIHSASSLSSLTHFRIDPEKAVVKLAQKLDAEVMAQHFLTILVKDQGTPSKRNYARLMINVTDHNEHVPEFASELFQIRVLETVTPGTMITRIQAWDRDRGLNAKISYSIISGNIGGVFHMEENSGIIRTDKLLDMDDNHEFMLVAMATDSGTPALSSTCRIHIIVVMAENDSPRFSSDNFIADVEENSSAGRFVIQTEARSVSSLYYEILNDEGFFSINPASGIITTNGRIDYETRKAFNLTVQATNMVGIFSRCNVLIHVLDLNDNSPSFLQGSYEGFIVESAPAGSLVSQDLFQGLPLLIKAADPDSGVNSLLTYEIQEKSAASLFRIDPHSGSILTLAALDREQVQDYEFTVNLRDNGTPRLYAASPARIRIHVMDINDNPPEFVNDPYNATLTIPAFEGAHIAKILATDPDEGSKLNYEIVNGDPDNKFAISRTNGLVTVIDPEGLKGSYCLEISVNDGIFTAKTLLNITTKSYQNSGLRFSKDRYVFNVSENLTKSERIAILNVVGDFIEDHVKFSIVNPAAFFQLDKISGSLSTTEVPLDRELKEKHLIIVEAKAENSGEIPRIARAVVEILVMDLNDNRPVFLNLPYHSAVPVDSPKGTLITKILAFDKDSGDNGRVRYALIRGNGEIFRVHPRSGEISLLQVLANSSSEYHLLVSAFDGGNPRMSAETSVEIKVLQREAPVFLEQFYSVQVPERCPLYTNIADFQSTVNRNRSSVIYSIVSGNEDRMFDVDFHPGFNEGLIYVAGELDYESRRSYDLILRATDPLSGIFSEVPVVVQVKDLNDCAPEFVEDFYSVSVPESLAAGSRLLQVAAMDRDSGNNSQITYALSGDDLDFFGIDPTSGFIYVKKILDFETKREHGIQVIAKDSGIPTLSSRIPVYIQVEDVNDNPPVFQNSSFTFYVSETAGRDFFVAAVKASDPDSIDGSRLFYSITGGNQYQIFAVNSSNGVISLANAQRLGSQRSYVLNISVTDGIFSSTTSLTIELLSANLNSPQFVKSAFDCEVLEDLDPGTKVTQIEARDPDSGSYGKLKFSIIPGAAVRWFRIDEDTGEIFTKLSLDRELQKRYQLGVTVTDGGGKSCHAVVNLRVVDVNDNPPRFILPKYRANIYANTSISRTFMTVQATDPDADESGRVSYYLYNPDFTLTSSIFAVNSTTGEIYLTRPVTGREGEMHQFFVRAEDHGELPLSSEVPVEISVIGTTEDPPVFDKTSLKYFISESAPVGTIVAHITAASSSGQLSYSVINTGNSEDEDWDEDIDSDQFFGIDSKGQLRLLQPLDREKSETHMLAVMASKGPADSPLVAFVIVTIHVMDADEHPPEFEIDLYEASVAENAPKGTSIIKVSARDKDRQLSIQPEVRYSLSSNSMSLANTFRIDSETGWITSLVPLDYETVNHYNFSVIVTESSTENKISSSANVFIRVQDFNDNPTTFTNPRYFASVSEGATEGTPVLQLETTDKDSELPQHLQFHITEGNPNLKFNIRDSGEIYVSGSLDREEKDAYDLRVVVTDGFYTDVTEVRIDIMDVNDNPPVCTFPNYEETLAENLALGTIVLSLKATDADLGENAKANFSLTGEGSENFSLDPVTGHLRISKPLDREISAQLEFQAMIQDRQNPEFYCTSDILIMVTDINDNPPVFMQDLYVAAIPEDAPVLSPVIKVHAKDQDLGINRKIRYFLIDSTEDQFSIDTISGIISLFKPLDRESVPSYNLTILAKDSGNPSLNSTTVVEIVVLDINDNPPEFEFKSYHVSIPEDSGIGVEILKVRAVSLDDGINAEITYSIPGSSPFKIDPESGSVQVNRPLDFEKTTNYLLTIETVDGGTPPLKGYAILNVTILDVNDNSPVFSRDLYTTTVCEDAVIGTLVTKISANDPDSQENGSIRYRIVSGDKLSQFRIDEVSGVLSVANRIDREMLGSYKLLIEAKDSGSPPLASNTTILVEICDINDNPPRFSQSNYSAMAREDKPLGFAILQLQVTDPDGPGNSEPFNFEIFSGNFDDSFRLEPNGSLQTVKKLNHRIRSCYSLQIRVFDSGSPTLYSDTWVQVTVIEESKYAPVIESMEIHINTLFQEYSGGVIGKIQSADSDPHDTVTYSLKDPQANFEIDPQDGTLIAKPGLDSAVYNINVSATDGKFISHKVIPVAIRYLDPDVLQEGVTVILKEISPEEFLVNYRRNFQKSIRSVLGVRTKEILIISIQPLVRNRTTRDLSQKLFQVPWKFQDVPKRKNLEILFAVQKSAGIYYPGSFVRKQIEENMDEFQSLLGHRVVGFNQGSCSSESCANGGTCYDRIEMEEIPQDLFVVPGLSFTSPRYQYKSQCLCTQGFIGESCEMVVRICEKDSSGSCYDPSRPLHFSGESYAQYSLPGSAERRLILSLRLRTSQSSGIVFTSRNDPDFIVLELQNGQIQFRFDCGNGEGVVRVPGIAVNDRSWHHVILERQRNKAEVVVDGKFQAQGMAPDKLEIPVPGLVDVFFGADVVSNGKGMDEVRFGFIGCLDDVTVNGTPLPNSSVSTSSTVYAIALKRFTNVEFACRKSLEHTGSCDSHPCYNGGTCHESFSGPVCKCRGFTGEFCNVDINECEENPCQNGGTCINIIGSFQCICSENSTGLYCSERIFNVLVSGKESIVLEEMVGIVVATSVIFLLAVLFIFCQRVRIKNRSRNEAIALSRFDTKELVPLQYNGINGTDIRQPERTARIKRYEDHPVLPPRPASYIPSSGTEATYVPLNNLDTVRSYGSAAEDLESHPMLDCKTYKDNLNRNRAGIANNGKGSLGDCEISDTESWSYPKGTYYEAEKIRNDLDGKVFDDGLDRQLKMSISALDDNCGANSRRENGLYWSAKSCKGNKVECNDFHHCQRVWGGLLVYSTEKS